MSAIGDYIHLTAAGYEGYGITKNNKNKGRDLADSIATQKADIYQRLKNNKGYIKNKNIKTFEELLNTTKKDLEQQKEDNGSTRAQLKKLLDERFDASLGKIDWSTLNVSATEKQKKPVAYVRSSMKLSTVGESLRQLNKIINTLRSTDGVADRDKIQQQIKALNGQYRILKKGIEKTDRGQTIIELSNKYSVKNLYNNEKDILENFESFRENLNTLISLYSSIPAINLQKGDLFEYLIAAAPLSAQELAVNAIEEKIRKSVLGKNREDVKFNKDVFTNVTEKFENGTLSTTRKAQGKIDVLLKWQGKDLKISAKNVNLQAYYIHILSGSSFLYMIQDLNEDFVNHFINVYSIQQKKESLAANFAQQKKNSMAAMKFVLMYKALTGDNYNRNAANVFAINDNSASGKGSIKVYTMEQLIHKIMSQELYDKGITINGKTTLNEKFKIEDNVRVNAAKDTQEDNAQAAKIRITNILSYLHSQKIHASLSTKAFSSQQS